MKYNNRFVIKHSPQPPTQVLKGNNVLNLDPKVEDEYIKAYTNNDEMKSVDVVYCGYPASLCQIYGKLNKSVFVQATTRFIQFFCVY